MRKRLTVPPRFDSCSMWATLPKAPGEDRGSYRLGGEFGCVVGLCWVGSGGPSAHIPFWLSAAALLNYLVGATDQRCGNGEPKRFCRLEVDNQLNFRDLLHRNICGLLPLKNAAGVDARSTV